MYQPGYIAIVDISPTQPGNTELDKWFQLEARKEITIEDVVNMYLKSIYNIMCAGYIAAWEHIYTSKLKMMLATDTCASFATVVTLEMV